MCVMICVDSYVMASCENHGEKHPEVNGFGNMEDRL